VNIYNVVKVLANSGIYFPASTIYGDVEIRPAVKDFDDEKECLKESFTLNKISVEVSLNSRISCIVEAENEETAINVSDEKFEEVLDLKSREFSISRMELTPCGYTKELESGILKPIKDNSFGPNGTFLRQLHSFQQIDQTQQFLLWNNELSERYKKSLHWSRNALREPNIQIKVMFMWFSLEALFKESENDQIAPYIRWFLGFPNGAGAQFVSKAKFNILSTNEKYEKWKKKLIDSLEKIREFRNYSVHSGFRRFDFSNDELVLYEKIMTLGAFRCQGAVYTALCNNLQTVSEFKEYVGVIFDSLPNIENDVHGNILYMLENLISFPHFKHNK
jgi:hypothetical protein